MFFKLNKKGKVGIIGVATIFIELVIYSVFLPSINEAITTTSSYLAGNTMALWLIQLLPLFIVIAITFGVFNKDENDYRGY
jgi:hypothetical protein